MLDVSRMHRAQDVALHPMLLQQFPAAHHLVERALAALIHPIAIMQFARSVDAQPHQKIVLLEERAPLVIQPRAVRLDRVLDFLPRATVLLDQRHPQFEKLQPHQRRLAALPGNRHLLRLRLQ